MKHLLKIMLCLLLGMLAPGCSWFRDGRPEPQDPPYPGNNSPAESSYTRAEAVNAAVSAISLRMASVSAGPFRILPATGKTSPLGNEVIESLTRMRLSRPSAPHLLLLEDTRTGNGEWSFTLRRPEDGQIFITGTFSLKGEDHAGP